MLEQYGVLTNVVPTGDGWWFEQEFRGIKFRLPPEGSAESAQELCELVRNFRMMNNMIVGDYEREIADHIKSVSFQNDRWQGRKTTEELVASKPIEQRPLIVRITNWMLNVANREPRNAPNDVVKLRCETCQGCPFNKFWQTECQPCIAAVANRGRALRGFAFHPEADMLRACALHDLYLPAAVCLDIDYLPKRKPEAPEFCWLKNAQ